MTDKLSEFLAVEVMGQRFRMRYAGDRECPDWYPLKIPVRDWSPPTNIEQAIMCAEKFHRFSSGKGNPDKKKQYSAAVYKLGKTVVQRGMTYRANGETLEAAISLACARAAGWEE